MKNENEPTFHWEEDFKDNKEMIKAFLTVSPQLKQYSHYTISYDQTHPQEDGIYPIKVTASKGDNSPEFSQTFVVADQANYKIILDSTNLAKPVPYKVLANFAASLIQQNKLPAREFYDCTFDEALPPSYNQQLMRSTMFSKNAYEANSAFITEGYLTYQKNGMVIHSSCSKEHMNVMNESIDQCADFIQKTSPDTSYLQLLSTNGDLHNNGRRPQFILCWNGSTLEKTQVFKPRNMIYETMLMNVFREVNLPSYGTTCINENAGTCEYVSKNDNDAPNSNSIKNQATQLGKTVAVLCSFAAQDLHYENFFWGENKDGQRGYFPTDSEALLLFPPESTQQMSSSSTPYIDFTQTFPADGNRTFLDKLLSELEGDYACARVDEDEKYDRTQEDRPMYRAFLDGFFSGVHELQDKIPVEKYKQLIDGTTNQRIVPAPTTTFEEKLWSSNFYKTDAPLFELASLVMGYFASTLNDPAFSNIPPTFSKLNFNPGTTVASLEIPTYVLENGVLNLKWEADTSGKYEVFCKLASQLKACPENDVPKYNLDKNKLVFGDESIVLSKPEDWLANQMAEKYQYNISNLCKVEEAYNANPNITTTFNMLSSFKPPNVWSYQNAYTQEALSPLIAKNGATYIPIDKLNAAWKMASSRVQPCATTGRPLQENLPLESFVGSSRQKILTNANDLALQVQHGNLPPKHTATTPMQPKTTASQSLFNNHQETKH